MAAPNRILLFDGFCNLCNGLVMFIQKRNSSASIHFAPLQSSTGRIILKKINSGQHHLDTVVYLSHGKYYFKSSAILHVLKDLGGGWQLCYGFIIIPRFIRDFLYDIISRSRYRIFGRSDSCIIPTVDIDDTLTYKL